jgi:hypothetical protein
VGKPRGQRTKPFKKAIRIICPGEIERGYFQALKDDRFRGLLISIEPKLGQADKFEKVFKGIIKDYIDDVPLPCFYVNDMDAIIAQDMLEKYKKAKGKALEASNGMLTMIETMPCIEFWFLLHYTYVAKYYPSYESIKKDVRNAIPDYDKNEAWAKKIYAILKDRIDIAIERAKMSMNNLQKGEGACSYTNMHELIEQLVELFSKR